MRPRVLIVDDEPDMLELVDFKLSNEGFEVIRAASGLEGLCKARCEAPNVIVLDVMLPDLDGLCVCEILCAQPSTRDVPVVIFSALDSPVVRSRKSRLSVAQWVKKGDDFEVLTNSVRAALNQHELQIKTRMDEQEMAEEGQQ